MRFVWCRLNPIRESEPEALFAGYVFQRCLGYRQHGALTGVTPRTYLHTDNRSDLLNLTSGRFWLQPKLYSVLPIAWLYLSASN